MATMWVTTFTDATNTGVWPYLSTEKKTISGVAENFTAYAGGIRAKVRIHADANCHYVIGESVTADTDDPPLPAEGIVWETILPGQRVSVIERA